MNAVSGSEFSAGTQTPDYSIGWGERAVLIGFLLFFILILALSVMVNPIFCLAGFAVLTVGLLSNKMSRAHGYIVLGGLGAIVLYGVCELYGLYKPLSGVGNALCLVSVQFLPWRLVALLSLTGILLFPFVLLEAVYWITRAKGWKWIAALFAAAVAVDICGGLYVERCKQNFDSVSALTGQTLSEETFIETNGEPVYYAPASTYNNPLPQWRYSDGKRQLSVNVNGDGTVTVNERAYLFLDL